MASDDDYDDFSDQAEGPDAETGVVPHPSSDDESHASAENTDPDGSTGAGGEHVIHGSQPCVVRTGEGLDWRIGLAATQRGQKHE